MKKKIYIFDTIQLRNVSKIYFFRYLFHREGTDIKKYRFLILKYLTRIQIEIFSITNKFI